MEPAEDLLVASEPNLDTPSESLLETIERLESEGSIEEMVEEPVNSFKHTPKGCSISVEQAAERLGPKVLEALEKRFNGSLVKVRLPDESDLLF